MVDVRIVATHEFSEAEFYALRELLDEAFEGGFTDDDWDHTVGGLHVLAVEDGGIISHAAVVERLLMAADRPLRTGYVEGVATALEHRGRGHASTVMRAIGKLIRGSYELGGLSTGLPDFYARLGWELWRGRPMRARRGGRSGRLRMTAASWFCELGPRSSLKRRFP
ncbi:MAG: GNAT family N-acetyltransferase [Actinomycetota bacterium]|nr:GNAT family N-acetyltransferase [Actinomycetota bacterium]